MIVTLNWPISPIFLDILSFRRPLPANLMQQVEAFTQLLRNADFKVQPGDRIAQLVLEKICTMISLKK